MTGSRKATDPPSDRSFDSGLRQLYHPRAMGQRPARCAFAFLVLVSVLIHSGGCDRAPVTNASSTSAAATRPHQTVASLSPAATEILIGLGLGERLVAVSNYDQPRQATKDLPRVGDYQTTDWERIATLGPGIMITQFGPNRLPEGMLQKADQLNIRLVNVSITRLHDIFSAMTTLAEAVGEADRGAAGVAAMRAKLDAVASASTGRKVRTLIVTSADARGVAGRDNYLHDVLTIAGGENVIAPGAPYPTIDREMLIELDPEVILQLLPEASPQVRESAARVWQSLPGLRAVREGRVHVIDDPWALNPTHHVGELAERFAIALNAARGEGATSAPATSLRIPVLRERVGVTALRERGRIDAPHQPRPSFTLSYVGATPASPAFSSWRQRATQASPLQQFPGRAAP